MFLLQKNKSPFSLKYIYLIAVVFSLVVILQSLTTNEDGQTVIRINYIILFTIKYLLWAVLFNWIYGLYISFNDIRKPIFKPLVIALLNALLLAIIHLILSNIIFFTYRLFVEDITISDAVKQLGEIFFRILSSRLLDLVIILGIIKIVDTYRTSQNRKLRLVELENQLHVSQLRSLRAQLNPHFLFNSLHALQTLIGHDDDKARSMVMKVSNLLRKILEQSDKQLVTLEEELDYLKDYLDIEQERFHDRLTVIFDIDKLSKNKLVPSLLLQPLAENAFKHGISLLEDNGIIKLSTKLKDNALHIRMNNTIPFQEENIDKKNSTKLGLKNLKNRLEQIYGDNQRLTTQKNKTTFTVHITIKEF